MKVRLTTGIHYGYNHDKLSPAYHLIDKPVSDFIVGIYSQLQGLDKGVAVVDLGCGDGRFVRYAPATRRWRFIGIDHDRAAVLEARKFLSEDDQIIMGDVTEPENLYHNSPARIGAAIAHRLLHGLPGKYHRNFMHYVSSILLPGGEFFITFAAAEEDWKAKKLQERGLYKSGESNDCAGIMFREYGLRRDEPFLVHFLTAEEFKILAQEAGFDIVDQSLVKESSGYSHLIDKPNTYHAFKLKSKNN